jgi:predicted enzyme related to lactoylglutathione lyase
VDSSNMPQPVEGQIIHVELFCDSIEPARKFYGDVFGWTFKEWGDTTNYLLFMDASGKLGGGFSTGMTNQGGGGTLLYIFAADIDSKLAQVEAAGGRTLDPKTEIPGVGFYATFVDPFGNHIGIFGG